MSREPFSKTLESEDVKVIIGQRIAIHFKNPPHRSIYKELINAGFSNHPDHPDVWNAARRQRSYAFAVSLAKQ